ncbi:MAG: DHA2 family efflux MFS transporter permease subunit [Miltoncostaeaceae bacterium]
MSPASLAALRGRLLSHPRWRWMALMVVAGGMMLAVVNVSIVNIALPAMAVGLGVDVSAISWVVTGFLVTQATLLALAGRAGDIYGRRRVFVAGVIVLCVASILCALSWNAGSLITFRILQAVGSCAMAPTAYSYAAELFAARERGQALGIMGGVLGLAPVVALGLAGVLVAGFGWRSVFWISPIVGVVVLAGAALLMVEIRHEERARTFDLAGALLAAVGLFGILLAVSRGEDWGWGSPVTAVSAAIGVVALVLFALHERRAPDPMVDLELAGARSARLANMAGGISAAALFGVLVALPFAFTALFGFGPVGLAFATMPIAAAYVLIAPLAGRVMGRVGSDRLAAGGFVLAAAGALWMGLAAAEQDYTVLLPGLCAFGVGMAMSSAAVSTTAISEAPHRLGVASDILNIARYTGGALGTAVLGTILHANLTGEVESGAGRADAAGRLLVADGFRAAMIAAVAFLAVAAVCAARMPRLRTT